MNVLSGKYFAARFASLDDARFIYELRMARGGFLHPTSGDIDQQVRYMRRSLDLRDQGKEAYLILESDTCAPIGCFRLTDLDQEKFMNYESLIMCQGTNPNVAIDVIFCVYHLAFEKFSREKIGPFIVRHVNSRVWQLHLTMGIANEITSTQNNADVYRTFEVLRAGYLKKEGIFKAMGFGIHHVADELIVMGRRR